MEPRKLSKNLIFLGVVVLVGALVWWASYYSDFTREFGGNLGQATKCIVSTGGECALAAGIGELSGRMPYNPIAFWIGAVVLVIGWVVGRSAK